MSTIILFGGSFDPIHCGHLSMARKALSVLQADQVIFIPAKKPRWKTLMGNDDDRLRLLQLALQDEKQFTFSTYELTAPHGGHYTIDTVRHFIQNHGEKEAKNTYYYLIGGDQLEKLDQWHQIESLSSLVQFVVYQRGSDDWNEKAKQNIIAYHVRLIEGERYDVSSTSIRNLASIDVPSSVLLDMMDHHLYTFHTIFSYLDERRYRHSCSVALLAKEIAEKNGIDPYLTFLAGILHDIGKNSEKTEAGMEIMKREWSEMLSLPSWAYHQFISATYARTVFHVREPLVLDAIACHCTGKPQMSPLAMILYASDKIDPLRGYDSSAMITACKNDYFEGFLFVLRENRAYLKEKGHSQHDPLSLACFQYYLKEEEE